MYVKIYTHIKDIHIRHKDFHDEIISISYLTKYFS